MLMFDYHIHTKYCNHAKGEMEEYVQVAIKKNLTEMGFSCHIPREFYPEEVPRDLYAMTLDDLNLHYFPEIALLQEKYNEEIFIKMGLEIDYFKWIQEPINKFIDENGQKLDYIIGSVHILNTYGTIWSVDDRDAYDKFKKFGVDFIYDQYIEAIIEMIHTRKYHILAHLDLPKKYGYRPSNLEQYFGKIGELLDEVKKYGMSAEISTGGLRKYIREQYPEDRIVKMMIERDIPLITSSDSHKPEEVAYKFKELYQYLKDLGVTQLVSYRNRVKKYIEID